MTNKDLDRRKKIMESFLDIKNNNWGMIQHLAKNHEITLKNIIQKKAKYISDFNPKIILDAKNDLLALKQVLKEYNSKYNKFGELKKTTKNQSDMGLGRTTPKKKATTAKRKPATKKQGTGSTKKTIRKHEGINQRTGKLKKGFKYGANGKIEKVKTPAQKARQTGSSDRELDLSKQAKRPGKRKSASGNTYYERRANRSDKGKLLAPIIGTKTEVRTLCAHKNQDGSTTFYSPLHGTSCYVGDKLTKVSFIESTN